MKLTDEQIETIKDDCKKLFTIVHEMRNFHNAVQFTPEYQEAYRTMLNADNELRQTIKNKIGLEPTQNLIQLFSWSPPTKSTIQEAFS